MELFEAEMSMVESTRVLEVDQLTQTHRDILTDAQNQERQLTNAAHSRVHQLEISLCEMQRELDRAADINVYKEQGKVIKTEGELDELRRLHEADKAKMVEMERQISQVRGVANTAEDNLIKLLRASEINTEAGEIKLLSASPPPIGSIGSRPSGFSSSLSPLEGYREIGMAMLTEEKLRQEKGGSFSAKGALLSGGPLSGGPLSGLVPSRSLPGSSKATELKSLTVDSLKARLASVESLYDAI